MNLFPWLGKDNKHIEMLQVLENHFPSGGGHSWKLKAVLVGGSRVG